MTDHPTDLSPPQLQFAFRILLRFDNGPRLRFAPAGKAGLRGHVAVQGGEISGPRLTGHVVPLSGGDWPRFWPGGLVEFEAHYQLQADDGTPIYIHNSGIAWHSPEVLARHPQGVAAALADHGLLCTGSARLRLVTHLDIRPPQVEQALHILRAVLS